MSDRRPMLLGATIMTVGLAVGAAVGLLGKPQSGRSFS